MVIQRKGFPVVSVVEASFTDFVPTVLGITPKDIGPSIIRQLYHSLALVFRASKYKFDLKTFKVLAVLLDSEELIRIEKPSEHQRLS